MDNIKREEHEKACKNYKVRARMVAVHMVRVLNMSVDETVASWCVAPHGFATGCAVTTKETLKASRIFPVVASPEEFREASWTPSLQT